MSKLTNHIVARYFENQRIASDDPPDSWDTKEISQEEAHAIELAENLGLHEVAKRIKGSRFLGAGDDVFYAIEDDEIDAQRGQELLGLLAKLWRDENPGRGAPAIFQDFVK